MLIVVDIEKLMLSTEMALVDEAHRRPEAAGPGKINGTRCISSGE